MNRISEEEKGNLLQNATTSFVHGIEHFVDYKNDEKNIKFSIIHIFNSVELILKAYLGIINEAVLWENIDQKSNKSASITILLNRMKQFSEIQFEEKLKNDIEKLRIKRNEIEHFKFVLENEKDIVKLLNDVIYGLLIFCKKNVGLNLNEDLTEDIENKFDNIRSEFDLKVKNSLDRVKELREKGYKINECPNCLNKTLACKKAKSVIKCFYCGAEFMVMECHYCDGLATVKDSEGDVICSQCIEAQNNWYAENPSDDSEWIEVESARHVEQMKDFFIEDYK